MSSCGDSQCKDGILSCRDDNDQCIVNCNGEQACNDATLNTNGASSLDLNCNDEQSCKVISVTCGEGVIDTGSIGTTDTSICDISCVGAFSCEDSDFDASVSTDLIVQCNGFESCKASRFSCPINADNTTDTLCSFVCEGIDSCKDVAITDPNEICTCSGSGCDALPQCTDVTIIDSEPEPEPEPSAAASDPDIIKLKF